MSASTILHGIVAQQIKEQPKRQPLHASHARPTPYTPLSDTCPHLSAVGSHIFNLVSHVIRFSDLVDLWVIKITRSREQKTKTRVRDSAVTMTKLYDYQTWQTHVLGLWAFILDCAFWVLIGWATNHKECYWNILFLLKIKTKLKKTKNRDCLKWSGKTSRPPSLANGLAHKSKLAREVLRAIELVMTKK